MGYQYNDEKNALIKSSHEYGGYRRTKNLPSSDQPSLRWDIPWVKGLSAKALIAYDPKYHTDKMLNKQYKTYKYNADAKSYDVVTTSSLASVTEWRSNTATPTTQLSLNYETSIKNKHNLKALLLFETRKWETSELSGSRNTLMDAVDQIYAGLVDDTRSVNGSANRNSNRTPDVYRL